MKADREWQDLLARHLEGLANPADVAAMNQRLRADLQARMEFVELLNLDSALAALAAAAPPVATAVKRPSASFWRPATALAALVAVLATATWLWVAASQPYATVISSAGAGLNVGDNLRNEPLELSAGSVELLTRRGARLVLEAPAAFEFESAQRLHLRHGRVAAEVPPPANGFTVITPGGEAVDLGTKFGVDVTAKGASEIHVFEGEVIAQPKGGSRQQSLRDGEALTLDSGPGAPREIRTAAFIRSDEMAALSAGLVAGQMARSEAANASLRRDPHLVAFLDFEDGDSPPGTFRMMQGRWPGSRAPEFVNVGDHIKVDVGGGRSWPQLTLAAWVRLDRLGEPYQSLYHTDGWQEDRPGQVHWMINRDTSMRLALRGNVPAPGERERSEWADSLTPVLPERGRWVHLVSVYDAQALRVRFYFNGRFDTEVTLATAFPARLGPAQIGNWNQRDRRLSGRVDDLILLGRAMSDAEVRALHAAGNPYR